MTYARVAPRFLPSSWFVASALCFSFGLMLVVPLRLLGTSRRPRTLGTWILGDLLISIAIGLLIAS